MKLLRKSLTEFSGTKKEIVNYLLYNYEDDYWIQEYGKTLLKDFSKLKFVVECLGLRLCN